MSLRIAHITDVHWMVPPSPWRIWLSKRALGTANLYIMGRRLHFHETVQDALVAYVEHLNPDVVIVTGDLTAQALPQEFEKARKSLDPLLSRFPTFVIPGNHDVYTFGAYRSKRIRRWFSPWMGLERHDPIGRMDFGDLVVLGLDPNRPGWNAEGWLPDDQLEKLGEVLRLPELRDKLVVLATHYPLMSKSGGLYDGWGHGLRNARALVDVLEAAPVRPRLILHGHKHQGAHHVLKLRDGATIDTYNPGSGGYAYNLDRRHAAAVNEYVFDGRELVRVERHLYDGRVFAIESGGAYASGW